MTLEGDSAHRLLEVLERAPKVPLTAQVRVDKAEVHQLVAALRESSRGASAGLIAAAEAVDEAVREAQPVPLTDQVRLSRERVADLAGQLRAEGA